MPTDETYEFDLEAKLPLDEFEILKDWMEEMKDGAEMVASFLEPLQEKVKAMKDVTDDQTEAYQKLKDVQVFLKELSEDQLDTVTKQRDAVAEMVELGERATAPSVGDAVAQGLQTQATQQGRQIQIGDMTQSLLGQAPEQLSQGIRQKYGSQIAQAIPTSPLTSGIVSGLRSGSFSLPGLGGGGAGALATPALGVAAALYGGKTVMDQFQSAHEYSKASGGTSVGESIEYDLGARLGGLSPFETSRDIQAATQATLRSGYIGESFDQANALARQGLKTGQLTTAQAIDLFDTNVTKAGDSAINLEMSLEALRNTAANTNNSMQTLTRNFQGLSESAVGAGASPTIGLDIAQGFATAPVRDLDVSQLLDKSRRDISRAGGWTPGRFTEEFSQLDENQQLTTVVEGGILRLERLGLTRGMSEDDVKSSGIRWARIQKVLSDMGYGNVTEAEAPAMAAWILGEGSEALLSAKSTREESLAPRPLTEEEQEQVDKGTINFGYEVNRGRFGIGRSGGSRARGGLGDIYRDLLEEGEIDSRYPLLETILGSEADINDWVVEGPEGNLDLGEYITGKMAAGEDMDETLSQLGALNITTTDEEGNTTTKKLEELVRVSSSSGKITIETSDKTNEYFDVIEDWVNITPEELSKRQNKGKVDSGQRESSEDYSSSGEAGD